MNAAQAQSSASSSQSTFPIPIRDDSTPSSLSGSSTPSSKKKKEKRNKNDPIPHPGLSLSSPVYPININSATFSQSTGVSSAQDGVLSGHATQRILEALAKFQTCLFLLTNTVLQLTESFKAIIPGYTSTMVVDRLSQSIAAIENNKAKGQVENGIYENAETRVVVDNEDAFCPSSSSLNVSVSSEASSTPCSKNSIVLKQRPGKIWSHVSKYIGIILALCASLCLSLGTLVVKYMEGYHPVSKVVWRLQGVVWPSLIIIWFHKMYQKKPLVRGLHTKGSNREIWIIFGLLVLRGFIGCAADIFQYYSLKYLPLADSTVIAFSTPIFVCVVAHYCLGEKCGVVPLFIAILTLCGVIVISKPHLLTGGGGAKLNSNNGLLLGNMYAFLCMTSATITTIVIRYLNNVHYAVTMFALGLCGTIEGLLVTLFTSPLEYPSWNVEDWGLACVIGGLCFCGQLTMTMALQIEEAGIVSLVRTCDVIFSFVWQVMFLNEEADFYSYLGALIVTSGVALTAVRKWLMGLPEHSVIRQRLFFLLR
ncbi:unnamed protein product [Orchesella dallaii]|uniref:EamA domain-containing protein n=1 Tax=Orchesella dallaii TaxID=48710 RepID=A0ABP1QHE7_9HEXA